MCPCLDVKQEVAHRFAGNRDCTLRFHLTPVKKIGQNTTNKLAIDDNSVSCLISKEKRPDDAAIRQFSLNSKFSGMQLRFLNQHEDLTHPNSDNFVC